MENEVWKSVIGYEGIYEVSDMGRVRSLNYGKSGRVQLLMYGVSTRGYLHHTLHKEGNSKTVTIHALVAKHFIDPDYRSKGFVVNHKNFNKKDNRLSNLEVVTDRENSNRKHIPSSSEFTGVNWLKSSKKWQSRIYVDGRSIHLGLFDSPKKRQAIMSPH